VLPGCSVAPIYIPPVKKAFPFGITTDSISIYWVELLDDGNPGPYDGRGVGRVMRYPKAGGTADVLVDAQTNVTQIALDGDYVYWVADEVGVWKLRRVPRACVAPCASSDVMMMPSEIGHLVRVGPGVLAAQTTGGDVYRVNTDSTIPTNLASAGANFAGLSATNGIVFVSSASVPVVTAATLDGGTMLKLAIPDAGPSRHVGFGSVATDCASVYGIRGPAPALPYRVDLDGSVTPFGGPPGFGNVFDAVTDGRYLYTSSVDAFGIFAFDLTVSSPTSITIAPDASAWNLTVDDDGVYWGEHTHFNPGTIVRMMKF
jgi:hypothetical protein